MLDILCRCQFADYVCVCMARYSARSAQRRRGWRASCASGCLAAACRGQCIPRILITWLPPKPKRATHSATVIFPVSVSVVLSFFKGDTRVCNKSHPLPHPPLPLRQKSLRNDFGPKPQLPNSNPAPKYFRFPEISQFIFRRELPLSFHVSAKVLNMPKILQHWGVHSPRSRTLANGVCMSSPGGEHSAAHCSVIPCVPLVGDKNNRSALRSYIMQGWRPTNPNAGYVHPPGYASVSVYQEA